MPRRIARQDGNGILYEDGLLSHADPALFEPGTWQAASRVPEDSGGRGATLFISHQGQHWVLRHYHRGGLAGRVVSDRYLWLGEDRTRSFREWDLLAELHARDFPVPRPVAARYRRSGPCYTADLITVRLPGVEALSARLRRGPADAGLWSAVGQCIALFHRAGVFHADLNAHNIQVDGAGRVFLLDFDRGRIRPDKRAWRAANLTRLHRSLRKISRDGSVQFTEREWRWLLDGYA